MIPISGVNQEFHYRLFSRSKTLYNFLWFKVDLPQRGHRRKKMSVSSDKINDAMARFLMSRYQRTVYAPVMGSKLVFPQNTMEIIKTHDSDFLG